MRIVFAGTPAVAATALRELASSSHEIAGVITRPPARQGRGRQLVPSPVGQLAAELGVPLIETSTPAEPGAIEQIVNLEVDLGVVVAYGAILKSSILRIPRLGWINLHFSNLPRWRGASPVQHTIMARDPQAWTSVFQLEVGLDTGPVYDRRSVELTGRETTGELLETLGKLGATQVVEVVDALQAGTANAVPQDEGVDFVNCTYAPRLSKADAFIDFTAPAVEVDALIRAVTPEPGAWTTVDGKTLRLETVQIATDTNAATVSNPALEPGVVSAQKNRILVGCSQGIVELSQVAPQGRKWMDAAAWWRGARLPEGTRLGATEDGELH